MNSLNIFLVIKNLETQNKVLPNNNSIVSKIFYGIIHIKYSCDNCGELLNQEYKELENIEINIKNSKKYLNFSKNKTIEINSHSNSNSLDNSFITLYLDELIDSYFEPEKVNSENICKKCKKSFIIKKEKTIYKFPQVIIINIDWGYFNKNKGFGFNENELLDENKLNFNEEIDLKKYAYNLKETIKYKIRSVITYPVINENNNNNKSYLKFMTFSRHLVDGKVYMYKANQILEWR